MSAKTVLRKARSLKLNGRHVAILFKGSRILDYAYNRTDKTKAVCTRFGYDRGMPHAEFAVLLKYIRTRARDGLRGISMMVLRWDARGRPATSLPCKTCEDVVAWFGVKKVYAIANEGGLVDASDIDGNGIRRVVADWSDTWRAIGP